MHTADKAIEVLEKIFGKGEITKHGLELAVVCPVCDENTLGGTTKKKLAIRTDKLICHCWSCEYTGKNLFNLVKTYKPEFLSELETVAKDKFLPTDIEESEEFKLTNNIVSLPRNAISIVNHLTNHKLKRPKIVNECLDYLFKRGLTEKDIWKYLFYASEEQEGKFKVKRVSFPSFGIDGKLNFYVSRRIDGKLWQKYINPPFSSFKIVFNEYRIDWKKEVVLVEGAFDMAKCPDNTIPLLGKTPNKEMGLIRKLIENSTPGVTVLLDAGAMKNAINVLRLLHEIGMDEIKLAQLPKNRKDPGESTKEEITQELKNAKLIDKRSLLKLRLRTQ